MNQKMSRLALTAASTLLAVPMQTQAVAVFDASAQFSLSVTDNTELGNALEFGQSVVTVSPSPAPTLIGDAQLDPTTNSTETGSGYIFASIAVGGSAGANGISGLASQGLFADGSITVSCPNVEDGIPCVFDLDITGLTSTLRSTNSILPIAPYEFADAQASVNFFGLEELVCGNLYCLGEGESATFGARALAGGLAEVEYPTTVSEPTTLALLGIGTLGLAALRRRRLHGK